jgi:hypothetical protein
MSEILYNFEANNGHIEDMSGHLNSIEGIRTDIAHLFNTLLSYYDSDSGQDLTARARQIDQELEGHVNEAKGTQTGASDQQELMHGLDRRLSAGL